MKPSDRVDYHGIIGGPVTKPNLVVRCDPYIDCAGQEVVFVSGVSGCVSVKALTPAREEEKR